MQVCFRCQLRATYLPSFRVRLLFVKPGKTLRSYIFAILLAASHQMFAEFSHFPKAAGSQPEVTLSSPVSMPVPIG